MLALALIAVLAVLLCIGEGLPMFEESGERTVPAGDPEGSLPDSGAAVYFFDVGQGDSALLSVGDWTALIDTGIRDEWDTLRGYLEALGVRDLDVVIATHPHADHIGSMEKVISAYRIGTFYMPVLPDDQTPTTHSYESMIDALTDTHTETKQIRVGTQIPSPDGTRIEVLSPEQGDRFDDVNNYSAVIRFQCGGVSFLLTGDAESEVEERLLREDAEVSADVLKCGHHGSSSSTTAPFLKAVAPQYAVISCGLDNDYGHPHRETMRALKKQGCEILRTDEGTSFAALTDGSALEVYRWTPEEGLFGLTEQPAA